MEGSRKQVEVKGIRICYDFDQEGRRRMVDIFSSSLAFHWEPRTSYPICRTQWKMKVWDTKVWDLLFKKYQELHERESRSGVPFDFGALLTLEVTCHWNQSGWLEPTPWELPGIDVPEKWQGGQGESQNASAPYPLRVSEHSGHWRSRAPSEDILGGALPVIQLLTSSVPFISQ